MRAPETPERLAVRPREAARMLSVGMTTLYEKMSSGELKSVKLGTATLIPISAIRALLGE